MSDKTKIINEYKKLIKKIEKHNRFYFALDNPKITDREYDFLKRKVINLEKIFIFK